MARLSSDSGESLGQLSFRLYYGEVLRQALQRARVGVLVPQWRQGVADSGLSHKIRHFWICMGPPTALRNTDRPIVHGFAANAVESTYAAAQLAHRR